MRKDATILLQYGVRKGQADRVVVQAGLRHQAGRLLEEFESLFGGEQPSLASLRPASPQYRIAHAHKVLGDVATGRLSEIGPTQTSALQAFAGRAGVSFDPRPRKPLADLASLSFRPRVLELCAGGGGLALGLERAGFEHVALIEFNKHAAATLRRNRPEWNVVEDDVRKVDFTQYRNRVDLLAGGLPCTPFTTVGEKKGKEDENDLMMEGVRAVREIAPKAFAFENVEGLLHSRHSDYVAALLRKFSKAGYVTDTRVSVRLIFLFARHGPGIARVPSRNLSAAIVSGFSGQKPAGSDCEYSLYIANVVSDVLVHTLSSGLKHVELSEVGHDADQNAPRPPEGEQPRHPDDWPKQPPAIGQTDIALPERGVAFEDVVVAVAHGWDDRPLVERYRPDQRFGKMQDGQRGDRRRQHQVQPPMRCGGGDMGPGLTELPTDAPDTDAVHEDDDDQKHRADEDFQNGFRRR